MNTHTTQKKSRTGRTLTAAEMEMKNREMAGRIEAEARSKLPLRTTTKHAPVTWESISSAILTLSKHLKARLLLPPGTGKNTS